MFEGIAGGAFGEDERDGEGKMIDLDEMRAMLAKHMAENYDKRFSFDTALYFVAKQIYNKGLEDGRKEMEKE